MRSEMMISNICCIGAGYVGGPTCSVIASKNPHVTVNVVDLNVRRINAWNSNTLPINEPNLLDIVRIGRDGTDGRTSNLHFSTDVEQAIHDADLIFVAVNTPTKRFGHGAGQALDVTYVESAIETIARVATRNKIIVEKSTVPCGTARAVREILDAVGRPGVQFEILSNPEFLAEGTAVKNLLEPDRVLIGSDTTETGIIARTALEEVYGAWVERSRIITMNIYSAELAKLAANALLAQRISSINALSAICETTGADVEEVAFACGLDTRIGPRMLKASIGYGGSCLKKDVLNLAHFSDSLQLPEIGSYWRSVDEINELQKARFARRIVTRLHNTLTDKKIAFLGCAFKKDTSDIRESAAVTLLAYLVAEHAEISVYDPQVKAEELLAAVGKEVGEPLESFQAKLHICSSAHQACDQANAVVIATEWDEFSNKGGPIPSTAQIKGERPPDPRPVVLASDRDRAGSSDPSGGLLTPVSDHPTTPISKNGSPVLDWSRIADSMRYPKVVFDGRNVTYGPSLAQLGLQVECIGKPSIRRAQ